jgi:iron complex transport system substrate-binding protein
MSLNSDGPATPPPRSETRVSTTVLVVAILVTAGVTLGAVGAFFVLSKASPPGSVRVTDDLGRSVNAPYNPSRVVVLGASIMDSMYRLGLRSHVVGVDCYAASDGGIAEDYSPDQIALWNLSQSMCVEVGPQFNYEALLNLSAQLVLSATIIGVSEVQEIQANYHIPVVMLQPPTLSGVQVDLSLLAQIFPVQSQANALGAQLSAELYNATTIVANVSSFPTVLVTYSVDTNGYWTFGPSTFGQSLIEFAGATSIAANSIFAYPELSPEQVLNANPQLIVYGTGFGLNLSYYATAPLWSSIPAVAHGNITGIDSNWITEPDPTMILVGLPALIAIFHPGTP